MAHLRGLLLAVLCPLLAALVRPRSVLSPLLKEAASGVLLRSPSSGNRGSGASSSHGEGNRALSSGARRNYVEAPLEYYGGDVLVGTVTVYFIELGSVPLAQKHLLEFFISHLNTSQWDAILGTYYNAHVPPTHVATLTSPAYGGWFHSPVYTPGVYQCYYAQIPLDLATTSYLEHATTNALGAPPSLMHVFLSRVDPGYIQEISFDDFDNITLSTLATTPSLPRHQNAIYAYIVSRCPVVFARYEYAFGGGLNVPSPSLDSLCILVLCIFTLARAKVPCVWSY